MRTKYLLAGIAASTLLATAALAQSSPPPAPANRLPQPLRPRRCRSAASGARQN